MKYFFTISIFLVFAGCSASAPENLEEHVNSLIAEDRYEQAFEVLENTDSSRTDADLELLREKTHLNYGIYLEYRGPEDLSMRDRMTSALEQYIAVLKINPQNQEARSEIRQIMGIYSTMPDRSPGKEILAELRKLGFEY